VTYLFHLILISDDANYQSHFGGSVLLDDVVTEQHRRWADACSEAFGGMDLLAIDVLHGKDGKDYIIEVNDTAIGFLPDKVSHLRPTRSITTIATDTINFPLFV